MAFRPPWSAICPLPVSYSPSPSGTQPHRQDLLLLSHCSSLGWGWGGQEQLGSPLSIAGFREAREWAIRVGLFAGNGTTADGQPNYMWASPLTREQAAQLFYRFAQDHGLA